MLDEVARGEVIEQELNAMIERRALKASGEQEAIEDLWKASTAAHNARLERERRARWYSFHLDQAERIRRTMTALVEAHERKAAALLGEGGP